MTTIRRPAKDCAWTLCGEAAVRGRYCVAHYQQRLAKLHRSQSPGERREKYGRGWAALRRSIVERDGGVCVACGASHRLEVHHMRGLSRRPEHLVTLCKACHSSVGSKRVDESVTRWMSLLYGGDVA